MNKAPAFQFYSNDFLVDTLGWSIEELGIYVRLLSYEWSNGNIPDNIERLARISGCSVKKFIHNWKNVQPKFVPKGEGYLQNMRLEETREIQHKYLESQRERANKRWHKDDATALPPHIPNECSSSSSSIYKDSSVASLPPDSEKPKPKRTRPPREYTISFDKEQNKFQGIYLEQVKGWEKLFNLVEVVDELKIHMPAWITANWHNGKGQKKDWEKFIIGWLSRQQRTAKAKAA